MNREYSDIRSRVADQPLWWDENAVPRYSRFAPDQVDIYADECVLLDVVCQGCGHPFQVAMSSTELERVRDERVRGAGLSLTLASLIERDEIHYGDPPNISCCPSGPSMNSVPVRVVEYWCRREPEYDWKRVAALERPIRCDWAEP